MLGALCEHLVADHQHLRNYKATVSKIREAQKLRNNFAHNGIWVDPETGKVATAKGSARGKIKTAVSEVTIADLSRVTVAIDEATRSLYALVLRVELVPPWERNQKT